jgi:membrane protease YdiL (CAAX protease family)
LLIGYVLLPMLAIRLLLRESPLEYGLRLNDVFRHWRYYAIFGGVMAVMAILASFNSAFLNTYPFYHLAGRSWTDLLLWELIYVLQFFCIEFFYRGFLLRTLEPAWGLVPAIWLQTVASTLVHLGKPLPEVLGAIPFGLLAGVLAVRGRSLWWPILLHLALGLATDVGSLVHQGWWLP